MSKPIRHIVAFNLKHEKDSPQAMQFIEDSKRILGAIGTVGYFGQFHEVSPKNGYDYGFQFDFANDGDYKAYSAHPDHVQYVKDRWDTEVTDFIEIDLEEI